jgi:hypothetical protein
MPDVKIKTPNRMLNAYFANTQNEHAAPGVVLIPDEKNGEATTKRRQK